MSDIGPALPPHLQKQRAAARANEQDSEDKAPETAQEPNVVGPALPPHLLAARKAKLASEKADASGSSSAAAPAARRPIGPLFPASALGPESDDEDDVGPRPDITDSNDGPSDGVKEFLEREERRNKLREEAERPKVMQREEWMLVPPEASDLLSSKCFYYPCYL